MNRLENQLECLHLSWLLIAWVVSLCPAAPFAMRSPSSKLIFDQQALDGIVAGVSSGPFHVSGRVRTGATDVPGALITLTSMADARSFLTASDDEGRFQLALPESGTYRVHIELFGFATVDRALSVTTQNTAADFTLALAPPVQGNAVQAEARATGSDLASDGVPPKHSHKAASDFGSSLSADIPMDFSFVTGKMAQSAGRFDEGWQGAPLRQWPVHSNASYQGRHSALDASPYALHGITAAKPEYAQNAFSAGLGSTLPWDKKSTTSLFASYSGSRNGGPYDVFATVPTSAMRGGDFSGLDALSGAAAGRTVTVFDPTTGQPFVGNRIPLDRISPAAAGLLQYIPAPSRDGVSQNFHFANAIRSKSDAFGLSLTRTLPLDSKKKSPARNTFNASLGYHRSTTDLPNVFPELGGDSITHGWHANLGYTLTKGFVANNLTLSFNSISSRILNHVHNDVAASLGINGVSRDSFDWGVPSIMFTQFTGLRDVAPTLRTNRNFGVADAASRSYGRHNLKWGGEFQRLAWDVRSSSDAEGSFVFTGFATAQSVNGVTAPGTGLDVADFLLGLPQKTHLQYYNGAFTFRGDTWDLFFLDDWRIAKNLSLNVGVRYEYASPFSEAHNRLATLDAAPDFGAVAVVPAGGVGPFSGRFPSTIVSPDRNNFAPRIGVAWRAVDRLILRAGYSIAYDASAYNSLATKLALQPPFAVGQTGIAENGQVLTLRNGFPAPRENSVSNDFAVGRKLGLSYAHIWVLQLQRELPHGFALVASYTGTRGSNLQMLRAPNRTVTGLLLPDVAPFLWQTNQGTSILHAGSLGIEKRLVSGLSFRASYMFSRSIDNAPALGDDTQVAQDDRALSRERGLSAFDQRHRLAVSYVYELPFGRGRHWLSASGIGNQMLGGWSFTGAVNYASGFPFTPHVLGAFADVEAGGYGALRPDVTGQPVQLSQPTVDQFFNTGAFTAPPAGHYGNAGRNIVIGPRTFAFDTGLAKSFVIADRHALRFRADVTNLLNTPQFMQVDTNLKSLSYGQITGVGPMRAIQLGVQYSF